MIVVSALVPLSAVVFPGNTIVPATLGSVVVVITGLRSVFHWHENYLRFSRAREAVEAERRRFRTGAEPYDDHRTREAVLAEAVTRIEQEETGQWVTMAAPTTRRTRRAASVSELYVDRPGSSADRGRREAGLAEQRERRLGGRTVGVVTTIRLCPGERAGFARSGDPGWGRLPGRIPNRARLRPLTGALAGRHLTARARP